MTPDLSQNKNSSEILALPRNQGKYSNKGSISYDNQGNERLSSHNRGQLPSPTANFNKMNDTNESNNSSLNNNKNSESRMGNFFP